MFTGYTTGVSRRQDLNLQPVGYKPTALPLSHDGVGRSPGFEPEFVGSQPTVLDQTKLTPTLMTPVGFEPTISRLKVECFNQLSYGVVWSCRDLNAGPLPYQSRALPN